MYRSLKKSIATSGLFLIASAVLVAQQSFEYPKARKVDHVDTYHGVAVPDPYRWLEDDNSAETAAWVEAQNKVTFGYLEKIPYRKSLTERVIALNNYEKFSAPFTEGRRTCSSARTTGCRTRASSTSRRACDGTPEVLIDPNTWSKDGTTRLGAFAPSKDAKYAVYGISKSGSDWQEYKVMELATKEDAARLGRVGQGLGRRVARRRLLLQPLSGAREGQGEGVDQREPPGLLPQGRHAAVGGHPGLRGQGQPAALPHRRARPRTSGSRS